MNLSSLDLNLLVVLDALLQDGSVTAAAKRVGLSQPALSNSLARLRDSLGDPLFVRDGRGLVPTARARDLAAPLRRALESLSSALAERTDFDPARSERTFTLAMPDIAELTIMPQLARRLRRDAPRITVRVTPLPAARPRDTLAAPDAPDLVVSMHDPDASIHHTKLATFHFVCLVRTKHPRVGRTLSMSRFLELEHVLVTPTGTPRGLIDEALEARGLRRRVALSLGHFFSAAMVVSRTDLVMSATSVLANTVERILGVRSVKHPLGAPEVTITQSWHPRNHDDPAHRWLRELVASVDFG